MGVMKQRQILAAEQAEPDFELQVGGTYITKSNKTLMCIGTVISDKDYPMILKDEYDVWYSYRKDGVYGEACPDLDIVRECTSTSTEEAQIVTTHEVGERLSGSTLASVNEGRKHDSGKPPMELLSAAALTQVAEVLGFGKRKYDAHNWRKGMAWSRLYGAALRHIYASLDGVDKDDESGLDHLAHAMCCLMFLLEYKITNTGTDDRFKRS